MAQLTVHHRQGSNYEVILNGAYPITNIRRKYETWLVPQKDSLLEVRNLNDVSRAIVGDSLSIKLVR